MRTNTENPAQNNNCFVILVTNDSAIKHCFYLFINVITVSIQPLFLMFQVNNTKALLILDLSIKSPSN